MWLAITLTLIGIPFLIKSLYRLCTFKSRARDMERARINVENLTKRCADARLYGNDDEILRRIAEGNNLDTYSPETVSVPDYQTANDLREIKQRMKNIDNNTQQLRDFEIYNPYKGK
jgi:hypothetical protein